MASDKDIDFGLLREEMNDGSNCNCGQEERRNMCVGLVRV